MKHLRIFGYLAFAHVDDTRRSKFDDSATKGIMMGYSEPSDESAVMGYRILGLETGQIFTSRFILPQNCELNTALHYLYMLIQYIYASLSQTLV
ncbi:hypothetical protein V1511DRAFT_494484 [Dipodascopsis uninucleata]